MRIKWIDTLKGLLIALVVLGHNIPGDSMLSYIISSFHMPLFFVVSGLLFNDELYSSFSINFIEKRIRSLIVPWLSFSLISILFSYMRNFITNEGSSLADLIKEFLVSGRVESNIPLWFLSTLFFIELTYYVINIGTYAMGGGSAKICMMVIVLVIKIFFNVKHSAFWGGLFFFILGNTVIRHILVPENSNMNGRKIFYTNRILKCFLIILSVIIWLLLVKSTATIISIRSNGVSFLKLILCTFCGFIIFVEAAKLLENLELLDFYGRSTVTILCTHILLKDVISVGAKFLFHFGEGWIHNMSMLGDVLLTAIMLLIEIPIIYSINSFLPWLVGRKIL